MVGIGQQQHGAAFKRDGTDQRQQPFGAALLKIDDAQRDLLETKRVAASSGSPRIVCRPRASIALISGARRVPATSRIAFAAV